MKYLFLFALIITFTFSGKAQKTIQMEKDGGVYKIACLVNGVKMKFIFDTGAAAVCISETMAEYLYENDYLTDEDFIGTGSSTVADGRIVDHLNINLRDIEIAGMHLSNVKAVVVEGQKAPLLLGQTAIKELGRISIDGDRLTIHNIDNNYSDEEIDKLIELAKNHMLFGREAAAIECFLIIDNNRGLSDDGLRHLALCYQSNGQYEECLQICKRWIREYDRTSDDKEKTFIYGYMANSFYFGLKDYNQAILWYQKFIPLFETHNYMSKFGVASEEYYLANCYYKLQRYYEAKSMFHNAIHDQCSYTGITIKEIRVNKVVDERLGEIFYDYAYCCYKLNEEPNGDDLLILAAKCGNEYAIKDCEKYKLNYKQTSGGLFD